MTRVPPGSAAPRKASESPPDDAPPPTLLGRFGRWTGKLALRIVVAAGLVAGAGYLARPHLPPRFVHPVESWLRSLPARVGISVESGSDRTGPSP